MLSAEHGKVIADARGDVQRGLDVVEFACAAPHVLKGEYTVGAGPGIAVYSMRQPIGIGAGTPPFNFPAMIPRWMGAIATVVGNRSGERRVGKEGVSTCRSVCPRYRKNKKTNK